MPYQNVPDELQDKMESCVMQVMEKDGLEKESAIAICYASVVEGKSMYIASIKKGMRNNAEDRQAIREIRAAAQAIHDTTMKLEPTDTDETQEAPEVVTVPMESIVYMGKSVKALPGGKVGGYLVTFGGQDVTGEYFDRDTDFGEHKNTPILYDHAMDVKIGGRVIGQGEIKFDDVGVWVEAQLSLRDEYEKAIYAMAEAGKLGWSSGTASHLVERKPDGKRTKITKWPLGLDASLTPIPAEPRNTAIPLKSWKTASEAAMAAVSTAENNQSENPTTEKTTMDENEIKAMMETVASKSADEAVKKFAASLPALATEAAEVKSKPPAFKNAGEFMKAVVDAAKPGGSLDNRLAAIKASGYNEGVDSEGGFLIPPEFINQIWSRMYATGDIMSRVSKLPVSGNGITLPAVDESSRATGSRMGGVQAYWAAEAAQKTPSTGKFRALELKLKKVIGLSYATDELLADQNALGNWLMMVMPQELAYTAEDAFFNGTGAGTPLGALNAPALVTVAKELNQTADTIISQNIYKMWERMYAPSRRNAVWLVSADAEYQLTQMFLAIGTAGVPVYLPPNGISGAPYGTLMGRLVIVSEYAQKLGDKGDILLADWSQYLVIEKDIEEATSIHVRFVYDETAFRFVYRCDGQPFWNSALAIKNNAAFTVSPFVTLAERA